MKNLAAAIVQAYHILCIQKKQQHYALEQQNGRKTET